MSTGFTSYECVCGGTITEEWGCNYEEINCDKCKNPIAKDLVEHDENGEMTVLSGASIPMKEFASIPFSLEPLDFSKYNTDDWPF
ncbi:MAG: hypothetical protein K0R54_545 [Clostridiaceae bacterium]|nr:hypothetical protein [Clostridiaceae bacterium]